VPQLEVVIVLDIDPYKALEVVYVEGTVEGTERHTAGGIAQETVGGGIVEENNWPRTVGTVPGRVPHRVILRRASRAAKPDDDRKPRTRDEMEDMARALAGLP